MFDCIVVGGGPAGLSAALVLARACRKVIVFDSGRPRNWAAVEMHGYLSRDRVGPHDFRRVGRDELLHYGVEVREAKVAAARCLPPRERPHPLAAFEVTLDSGQRHVARRVLLATGVVDVLPEIEGFREFYGRSVHHCPYCDGWEHRDQRLAAFGEGRAAAGLAIALRTWSPQVTACTHGIALDDEDRRALEQNGIQIRQQRVIRLEGSGGQLERIIFDDGPPLPCDALFFNTDQTQRSDLPSMLGCEFTSHGTVDTSPKQRTGVPGLYLAGDADGDVQFVIVAAAEGATAAVAINRELQDEDRGTLRA